jgi:hypothetical protein
MTTWAQVAAWAERLPETTTGPSYGGFPAVRVNKKLVVRLRGEMAGQEDPLTGAPYGEVLVVGVADLGEKEALLSSGDEAWFTLPHYDGHPSVLVRLGRLDAAHEEELFELLTDAWLGTAPRRAVTVFEEGRS